MNLFFVVIALVFISQHPLEIRLEKQEVCLKGTLVLERYSVSEDDLDQRGHAAILQINSSTDFFAEPTSVISTLDVKGVSALQVRGPAEKEALKLIGKKVIICGVAFPAATLPDQTDVVLSGTEIYVKHKNNKPNK